MNQAQPNSLLIKITLLLTSTLTVMSGATIAPSLPAMQEYFAEVENVELLVRLILTIPALFIALSGMIVGQIIDNIGRKPLLISSTLIYGIAGSSGFILNSLWAILISRAFLGISVAGIMTGVTTLIADYYQDQKRAKFMGLQAAFMGLGGVIFLSLGGLVADLNWRFPFLIYLSAWIILFLIAWTVQEPNVQKADNRRSETWQPSQDKIPIGVLVIIYSLALSYMVAFYLIPVQLPFYLKDLSNSNSFASGLALAASTLASALSSLRYSFVKESLDFFSIVIIAFSIAAIGYLLIGVAGNYQIVLLGLIIVGLGFGLLLPNLNLWLASIIPHALRGRALGGLTTCFFLGQFLSPIISQPITNEIGLGKTYSLAGILLSCAALIFFAIKKWFKCNC